MKERVKTLWIKGKGWLLLGVLMLCGYSLYDNYKKSQYIEAMAQQSVIDHNEFKVYRDKMNREHAQVRDIPEYLSTLQPDVKEKIAQKAKELGVKPESIKEVTEVGMSTKDTIIVHINDSTFEYTDGYMTLDGKILKSNVKVVYDYKDTANFTRYTKKSKVLGITFKTEDQLDIHFNNPKTSITNVTHVSLKKYTTPKRWGIGPSGGVTYYNGSIRPYIGIGLSYSIIKF